MPRNNKFNTNTEVKRDLLLKDDDSNYGIVTKKLGSGKFSVSLNLENREVIGRLCGKFKKKNMKKRNWVEVGSMVLVGLRDFQDKIVDIIHVYIPTEIRQLKKLGEIVDDGAPDLVDESKDENNDIPFDFEDL